MTRVVAGLAKGKRLAVPGSGTRPTSDRAREALFSSLEAQRGELTGAGLLDLYAGSGAVGLEALSRGATEVHLVESDAKAVRVLRANVAAVGLPGATVISARVSAYVSRPPVRRFEVVFLDPPYAEPGEGVREVLQALVEGAWLAEDATIVLERSKRDPHWEWPSGIEAGQRRDYGEASLWYGRAAAAAGRR